MQAAADHPTDNRTLNRRIVEALADQCCWLDLDNAPGRRIWACHKAAWTIEQLDVDIGALIDEPG